VGRCRRGGEARKGGRIGLLGEFFKAQSNIRHALHLSNAFSFCSATQLPDLPDLPPFENLKDPYPLLLIRSNSQDEARIMAFLH